MSHEQVRQETTRKEDKGRFIQIPYAVIDHQDISDPAKFGFIKFCRLFNKKGNVIEFRGFYRGLAAAMQKSPNHIISIVEQWEKAKLAARYEDGDGVFISVDMDLLWAKNKLLIETQQCSKYEQKSLYAQEIESSAVHKINGAVHKINGAVHILNCCAQNMNSRGMREPSPEEGLELKKISSRLLDYTRLLLEGMISTSQSNETDPQNERSSKVDFEERPVFSETSSIEPFQEDDLMSHKHVWIQGLQDRMFEDPLPILYCSCGRVKNTECSAPAAAEEAPRAGGDAHDADPVPASVRGKRDADPADRFPAPNEATAPVRRHRDGQRTAGPAPAAGAAGRTTQPPQPDRSAPVPAGAGEKRVDHAQPPTQTPDVAERKLVRQREIIALVDKTAEVRLPRTPRPFVREAMEDLIHYSDADIAFSVLDVKARKLDLTYQQVAKNMATACTKRSKGEPPGNIIPINQRPKGSPTGKTMTSEEERKMYERTEQRLARMQEKGLYIAN